MENRDILHQLEGELNSLESELNSPWMKKYYSSEHNSRILEQFWKHRCLIETYEQLKKDHQEAREAITQRRRKLMEKGEKND